MKTSHPWWCASVRLAALFFLAFSFGAASGNAASISWGGAQNITGVGDVITAGTLVGAYNVGTSGVSSQTLNGVAFQSFAVANGGSGATVGNFALAGSNFLSSNSYFGSTAAPFTTLPGACQALLGAAINASSPFTLTISGLILGAQYQFQWWANWSSASANTQLLLHTATAGSTVTLADNASNTKGGLGQFVIGSFTADASTQVIEFGGPYNGLLNGFQLRQTGAPRVPETGSTLALVALALGGLAIFRRQNSRLRG